MGRNGNGITAELMIDAIEQANGFVTKAAEILGISRNTFYVYLRKYTTAQQALEDKREQRHDFVELKMMERINEGSDTMIIFYAKTQMKERGYVERQEIAHSGPDGGTIKVTLTDD